MSSDKTPLDKCKRIPLKEMNTPKAGRYYFCYGPAHWIVTPQDELLMFHGFAPQCNVNKEIAESVRDKLYPDCRVEFLPWALLEQKFPPS